MKTKYNFELIRDYLDGILESQTMNEIKHLIATDEHAREIARGILIMRKQFENDQEIDQYLTRTLSKKQEIINNETQKKTTTNFLKIAAVILLLAVSSVIVYQLNSPSIDDILSEQISNPYKIPVTLRNDDNATNKGFEAYNAGDYSKSIQELKDNKSSQAVFTKGLSHFYLAEYELAIKNFSNKVLYGSRYEEQSRWYLALAYLKNREMEKSKDILEVITSKSNHYKKKEAKLLIRFLNDSE